jgi:hypothetical protein
MDMPRAKKTSTKTPSKSDFIRSQPATLSAAEVVAKGKADGVTILPGLVYEVRRKAKATAKGKAKKTAAPKSATTPTKTTVSKSDFIRSQPAALSAAEVVAKAKAQGIKLDRVLVYKVRIRERAKGKSSKTVAAKKTGVSVTKPSEATKPPKSNAAFVRGLPASTPAKDVVKLAKAAGLKLGVSYVYNIRGAAKIAAKKKRAGAKSPAVSAIGNGGGSTVSTSAQNLLKAVAAELGLGAAIEILSGERARVRAVIGG